MLRGEAEAWAPASSGFAEPPTRDRSREGPCPPKVRGTRPAVSAGMWRTGGGRGGGGGRVGGCQPRWWGSGCPLTCRPLRAPSHCRSPSHSPRRREDWIYGSGNLGITPPESDQPKIVKIRISVAQIQLKSQTNHPNHLPHHRR